MSHNPYFNRWFSAIYTMWGYQNHVASVTILILIDGFLQCNKMTFDEMLEKSQSLF